MSWGEILESNIHLLQEWPDASGGDDHGRDSAGGGLDHKGFNIKFDSTVGTYEIRNSSGKIVGTQSTMKKAKNHVDRMTAGVRDERFKVSRK